MPAIPGDGSCRPGRGSCIEAVRGDSVRSRPFGRLAGAPTAAGPAARSAVRLEGIRKRYGDVEAVAGIDLDVARRRVLLDARAVRLGQDHDPADDRRIRAADGGPDPAPRTRTSAGWPPFERDVNTVFQDYALFPHMTVGENVAYGLMIRKVPARGAPATRVADALRMVRLDGLRRAPAGSAVGRPAPAGRPRPGARQPAAGAAARRAARCARPEAARGDADRAQGDPAGGRDHVHLRDPRPGGGAHDERPARRLQPGSDRAGRLAGGGLRATGDGLRGRLRGHLEPPPGRSRRADRRVGRHVHRPAREDPAGRSPARPAPRTRSRSTGGSARSSTSDRTPATSSPSTPVPSSSSPSRTWPPRQWRHWRPKDARCASSGSACTACRSTPDRNLEEEQMKPSSDPERGCDDRPAGRRLQLRGDDRPGRDSEPGRGEQRAERRAELGSGIADAAAPARTCPNRSARARAA